MVAFGRLAFTGRLFLGVLTIYLVYAAITLLLPGEQPQTLRHLQEDIAVKPGEGCEGGEGEGCQNVKTGEGEAEKEENVRLKAENAKLLEENVKLKEEPEAKVEQAKPWISENTDVRLWIGSFHFVFSFFKLIYVESTAINNVLKSLSLWTFYTKISFENILFKAKFQICPTGSLSRDCAYKVTTHVHKKFN